MDILSRSCIEDSVFLSARIGMCNVANLLWHTMYSLHNIKILVYINVT